MKIELKKISFNERMSQETNCFVADLWINGKKVGEASNEGHGGCTDYGSFTPEGRKAIAEAEAYYKSLPKVKDEKYDFESQPSLEDAINDFLETHLKAKDLEKVNKKMQKAYATFFCIGKKLPNGFEYGIIGWKGRTLAQMPLALLQSTYNDVKANKLKNGDVILNDNLEKLGIKL